MLSLQFYMVETAKQARRGTWLILPLLNRNVIRNRIELWLFKLTPILSFIRNNREERHGIHE